MERKIPDTALPTAAGQACKNLDDLREMLDVCLTTAEQLLQTVLEESQILKRFQADALLQILPKKERLVRCLHNKLVSLKDSTDRSDGAKADPQLVLLRESLQQIEQVNQANHIFIENTLAYYDDFLKRFTPVSYGLADNRSHQQDCQFYRGRTFRKEI